MKVKDVYQDEQGNWHIDYGVEHLMGLAFRVYLGHIIIVCIISIPMICLGLIGGTISELIEKEDSSTQQIAPQANYHLIR
ncbi:MULTISPECIES: hypothetical protein [unclassified Moorena]|uniref:hypothetical protein n=1 Tax=unclassified Moorena TaxID=2683338 RepID=UPI0013C91BF9|nr:MULTISPECIES: hypothetical protein [unclassified Moorena]NEO22214.1 hypothetical protein [Moorena sp. SIO4A5]NEQ61434.1 hypothetical protein [Moorena sp. SIO4A1]